MPAEKNHLLRIVVPIVVIAVGVIFVASVFTGNQPKPSPAAAGSPGGSTQQATPDAAAQDQAPAPGETEQGAGEPDLSSAPSGADEATPVADPPEEDAAPETAAPEQSTDLADLLDGLRAQQAPAGRDPAMLGGLDDPDTEAPDTQYRLQIQFTPFGAGIEAITAARDYETIKREQHYRIQERAQLQAMSGGTISVAALAARAIEINGVLVDLFSRDGVPVWRETAPGEFEAVVENGAEAPIVRVTRRFVLEEKTYDVRVEQRVENLTDVPLTIAWIQYGPVDLPPDFSGYRIDTRRLRYGFLDTSMGPQANWAAADGKLQSRASVLDDAGDGPVVLWPRPNAFNNAGDLIWIAQTSRYFGFAIHSDYQLNSPDSKALDLAQQVYGIRFGDHLIIELHSPAMIVEPGSALDLHFGAYAGPIGHQQLIKSGATTADVNLPLYKELALSKLVVYNLGGPCAFCTFQPLARLLISTLDLLHNYVVFDWALAIMVLVVIVRTILHPITKKAQINMRVFSEQMQRLAPKQKKLQEKYRDDPKRMQVEMAKLMREEGVRFTGMLGCLPMFLQTPIWIALYAMLYFAFELRHEAAYFGIFQKISGGQWEFLGDLSTADHFISFGRSLVTLPLMGDINAINVLPILLGIVFFLHQKYLTPPPSASMTPEQLQQQKIMKVMMVVMFPVFMYNAPSGLAIYFITNSALGIVESRWIRAHVDQKMLERAANPKDHTLGRKKVSNKAAGGSPFRKDRDRRHFKDRK